MGFVYKYFFFPYKTIAGIEGSIFFSNLKKKNFFFKGKGRKKGEFIYLAYCF